MAKPKIIVYFKPFCGWNPGVLQVLDKHGLSYETRNVIQDREAFAEMVAKTGQSATPSLDIGGHLLVDVGGQEVEEYLAENGLSNPSLSIS